MGAQSQALAVLEILMHINRRLLPDDYVMISIDVPDPLIEVLVLDVLPQNWRENPPPLGLKRFGDDWARSKRSAALLVPSVLVSSERNVLINPDHPYFTQVAIGSPIPYQFDMRLFT